MVNTCVPTHNRVDLWRNLCTSLLYFVVRARCRRKESSRSLCHLLMSFLLIHIGIERLSEKIYVSLQHIVKTRDIRVVLSSATSMSVCLSVYTAEYIFLTAFLFMYQTRVSNCIFLKPRECCLLLVAVWSHCTTSCRQPRSRQIRQRLVTVRLLRRSSLLR